MGTYPPVGGAGRTREKPGKNPEKTPAKGVKNCGERAWRRSVEAIGTSTGQGLTASVRHDGGREN
jgi:hypothetical protein